jgi:hypothetical protein
MAVLATTAYGERRATYALFLLLRKNTLKMSPTRSITRMSSRVPTYIKTTTRTMTTCKMKIWKVKTWKMKTRTGKTSRKPYRINNTDHPEKVCRCYWLPVYSLFYIP